LLAALFVFSRAAAGRFMEEKKIVTVGDIFSEGEPSQNLKATHRYDPITKRIILIQSEENAKGETRQHQRRLPNQ